MDKEAFASVVLSSTDSLYRVSKSILKKSIIHSGEKDSVTSVIQQIKNRHFTRPRRLH